MTRPLDKHLDRGELDGLVSSQGAGVGNSGHIPDPVLAEVQRHVDSCQDCSRKLQLHRSVQSEIVSMGVPSNKPPGPDCAADTDWFGVAAGLMPEAKAKELMKHAAQCEHCGPLLRNAAETLADEATPDEEGLLASLSSARPEWQENMASALQGNVQGPRPKPSSWRTMFAWPAPAYAFAALAVVVMAAWIGVRTLRPPSAEQLLAQAYSQRRTIEVRIPGAKYAPLRVERGEAGSNFDKPASLLKAEVLISERLQQSPTDPNWLQAKARADLLDGNYDEAIKSLQRALESRPDSPQLLADLGSAYFLRAQSANRAIDYGNAIESLGKALAANPEDPVALFNRALACEQIFLYTQAIDDWEHYLRIDPQGEWSDEARRRLAAVNEKLQRHDQSIAEPMLSPSEIASANADDAGVRNRVNQRVEDYLSLATRNWLPRAYPVQRQESSVTGDHRSALRLLANVLSQEHGDEWMADLLSGATSPGFQQAVEQLAFAVEANNAGNNVLATQHAREAESLFSAAGNNAGLLRARVEYIFAQHDAQDAMRCVESTNGQEAKLSQRHYHWLRIQFHLEQGTCYGLVGEIGTTHRLYQEAANEAKASGYDEIYLRSQDHLSTRDAAEGNLTDGWSRTERGLGMFWAAPYPEMRGYNFYLNLYEFARAARQPNLQMAVSRDGLTLSESFSDNVLRAMAHSLMASAAVAAGQSQTAKREFSRSSELFAQSPQIASTRIARIEAEARLAEVEIGEGRAQSAVARLRQFAPEVAELSDRFLAVLFYTALGNAEAMLGDGQEADSALRSAIQVSELHLESLRGDVQRMEWTQRTADTYRNFAQLRLKRGDGQGALEIWEWYRGAGLRSARIIENWETVSPQKVAAELPSLTKETLVSYALLPRGLAVWVYDDRGVFSHWSETNPAVIAAQVQHFRLLCADPKSDAFDIQRTASSLYEILVAPVEPHLLAGRTLVIELDDEISGLPFDALMDPQNRYLGDRYSTASSLGIYYRRDPRTADAIHASTPALVAAVPNSSARTNFSLPTLQDAASEGEMVARDFRDAHLLAGSDATVSAVVARLPTASLFHFAGHAISSPRQSGLLLSDALLNPASLGKTSLAHMQLAVFSACDTQDGSTGGAASEDSLVRTFLRAGVANVVASRWNVDSGITREFMELFYRSLLEGNTVVGAIHQAQSGLRSRVGLAHPYYWSAFTAFGAV